MKNAQLKIQNLKCGGCEAQIKNQLEKIGSISNLVVDVDNGTIEFKYESIEAINLVKMKLKQMGYPLEGTENTLGNQAKSYVSCLIGRTK